MSIMVHDTSLSIQLSVDTWVASLFAAAMDMCMKCSFEAQLSILLFVRRSGFPRHTVNLFLIFRGTTMLVS
jgi:hypothetical protein